MIRTQILGDYEKMFQPILLLVLLIALITGLGFYSDVFLTGRNWLNILNNHMAHQLILAVGMNNVHTVEEYMALEDLYKTTEALVKYIEKNI